MNWRIVLYSLLFISGQFCPVHGEDLDDPYSYEPINALSPTGKGTIINSFMFRTITHKDKCYRMKSIKGNLLVPNYRPDELNAFIAWAQSHPDRVTIIGCQDACGDGYCNPPNETPISCKVDCQQNRNTCANLCLTNGTEDFYACYDDCIYKINLGEN